MSCDQTLSAVLSAIAFLAITVFINTNGGNADDSAVQPQLLKVEVLYETLCPDSVRFIRRHLYPAMVTNNWLQYTDLQFVPYGKVGEWTDPSTNITKLYCQHGDNECELNALHACIVEHHTIAEQLSLISCLLSRSSDIIDQCAAHLNIDVSEAKTCKETRSTVEILRKYGALTNALDISFVPTMVIDEVFDRWKQSDIRYYFESVFCRKYKQKYNVTLEKCGN